MIRKTSILLSVAAALGLLVLASPALRQLPADAPEETSRRFIVQGPSVERAAEEVQTAGGEVTHEPWPLT